MKEKQITGKDIYDFIDWMIWEHSQVVLIEQRFRVVRLSWSNYCKLARHMQTQTSNGVIPIKVWGILVEPNEMLNNDQIYLGDFKTTFSEWD